MAETRIGIIGTGGFGCYALEQYVDIPDVRITGVSDIYPASYVPMVEKYAIPIATTDWRELVTHDDVDIIYLATPPFLHAEQAVAAMEAGKHVLCEKPLAVTLAEADRMLEAARHNSVRLGINFVMRFSHLYGVLRTLVEQQWLGIPQYLQFTNVAMDLPSGHWFWDPARSGGIPVEHGVHFFDIFSNIFGQGTLVNADVLCRPTGEEDKWHMLLKYGERLLGNYYHAFDTPRAVEQTNVLVTFERGWLRLESWIPDRLTIDGVVTEDEAAQITAVIPSVETAMLPEGPRIVLANGMDWDVTHHLWGYYAPAPKSVIYAQAVRELMTDFIAWTKEPAYQPRVTAEDGRAALAIAVAAVASAHQR